MPFSTPITIAGEGGECFIKAKAVFVLQAKFLMRWGDREAIQQTAKHWSRSHL